jgi:Rap1a immunity proteins
MINTKVVATVTISVLSALPCWSCLAVETDSIKTGADVLRECQSQDEGAQRDCKMRVVLTAMPLVMARDGTYCLSPEEKQEGSDVKAHRVAQWLQDHPEENGKDWSIAILDALRGAYPCKR